MNVMYVILIIIINNYYSYLNMILYEFNFINQF